MQRRYMQIGTKCWPVQLTVSTTYDTPGAQDTVHLPLLVGCSMCSRVNSCLWLNHSSGTKLPKCATVKNGVAWFLLQLTIRAKNVAPSANIASNSCHCCRSFRRPAGESFPAGPHKRTSLNSRCIGERSRNQPSFASCNFRGPPACHAALNCTQEA